MITIFEVINMNARRFTDDFVNNCIELNKSGLSLTNIAKRFRCAAGHLSIAMKKRGYDVLAETIKTNIPQDELIELYTSGWSVKKLAEKYAVSRNVITRRLIKQGIKPRNRSESMFNRMKFTSEEERKNLAKAANDAVRGKSAKRERLIKGSITRRRNPKFIGFGEDLLKNELVKIGLEVIPQFIFDIYNIDLLVDRHVAVEVKIGMANPLCIEKNRVKTKKLLDCDFDVIWINASSKESFIANLSNIVSYINIFCSNPSPIRQYRVIRCYFDTAHRQDKLGRFTSKLAFKKPVIEERALDIHFTD